MPELTDWDLDKYRRQIMIPGFGEEGQRKLKAASVLVTRVGGLGGTVAFWLAAAGVGRLVIAHGGVLTPSNLNRQITMRGDGVGQPRIPQAKETLERFNPDIEVIAYDANATEANAAEWVADVDVVCDSSPDFGERFILNRECWRQGKPLVDSGMNGMEAQLTTILPPRTPCLQCLVPDLPDWWDPLGFGVLGALPGALGGLTALEVLKVLTGYGEPLAGRLLVFDGEDMSFATYDIARRPGCPVCGGA
jgi:molybdopterin/thiamine biosynthesis adenylyltransferase